MCSFARSIANDGAQDPSSIARRTTNDGVQAPRLGACQPSKRKTANDDARHRRSAADAA